MSPPRLDARQISMDFGSVRVLRDVDLTVDPGEIHAVIGENGAGKSTLMKILAGQYQPTAGQLSFDGRPVTLREVADGERLGILLIHQEFNLADSLTVRENVFLGREPTRGGFLDEGAMQRGTQAVLARLRCQIDPRARVGGLRVSEKQLVEIARALSRDASVLIMDEPTAVLTRREAEVLFALARDLRAHGVAIIYISHRLDEVKSLADRVTVLRDGRVVASRPAAALDQEEMARLMVGRELSALFPPKTPPPPDAETVFAAREVEVPGYAAGAGFTLRRGEILGVAGLVGAGRTELFEGILGLRARRGGRFFRSGREVAIGSYEEAVFRHGLVYLSEDRKGKGLLVRLPARPNVTLLALRRLCPGWLDPRREQRTLDAAVRDFDVRLPTAPASVDKLSGGNQQKLALAKIMAVDPEILVLDEPTRGIDVGTKQQIYHLVRTLAQRGKSVVLISSELPEIVGLSHRVLVVRDQRIVGTLEGEAVNEVEIMRYATGLKKAA